ncbi:MAG: EFR1 family ferrodoxin [Mobilitalea sp.]
MSKHIIYVFSGTGNSLWAAKEIAKELGDCEIATMGSSGKYSMAGGYDSIGFVYPTYAGGMPRRVKEFVSHLDLQNNRDAYFFAIATCGRISRAQNVVTQLRNLLKHKGIKLSYGDRLDMFSNYVVGYEMRDTVREEADQSAADIKPMIESIKLHMTNNGNTVLTPRQLTSIGFMHIVSNMDKNFNVSDACTSCGICKKVCPMGNIELVKGAKPCFGHHCEQCLACIQCCPTIAINYKDRTQNRKRYLHPDIAWKELAELNKKGQISAHYSM